jgi:nitrite reductase/ring-hydroxylating ferredoxin subunit
MPWIKVLSAGKLPEGSRQVVDANNRSVLLIHHNGRLYAIASACPHMRFPLRFGRVTDDGGIICPFHHSAFDLASGDVKEWSPWPPLIGPILANVSREKTLLTYPVKVENGEIFVEIREVSAML